MEPHPVRLAPTPADALPLAGPWSRPGVPALKLDGRRAIPALRLNGSTVPTLPRALRFVGYAVLILTAAVVVALATVPRLTPLRFYAVTSGSMVPALPVGTVTIVDTDKRTPKVGAVVAFDAPSDPDQVFTHRVIAILPDGSFRTEGDALRTPDPWTVRPSDVVGTVTSVVPYAAWGLAVMKVAVLLTLAAYLLRFAMRRGFSRRPAPELLVGGVLTGSLFYLLDVLRPVFGAGVSFLSMSHRTVRINVINTGWVPIRAFSLADRADLTARVPPDSTRLATLHFPARAGIAAVTRIKVVPALSLGDFIVMGLIVFAPFVLSLVCALRTSRRGERIEVRDLRRLVPADSHAARLSRTKVGRPA